MAVEEWAWTPEGRVDQARITWRAASRCVAVWEEVPRSELSWLDDAAALAMIALPRCGLVSGPLAGDLPGIFRTLLQTQHALAFRDGHGPHYTLDGRESFGRYCVELPPYLLDSSHAEPWLHALSSAVHAMSALLWREDWIPGIDDMAEYDAQVAAGPIRATVHGCVSSVIARPCNLPDFVAEVLASN